MKRNSEHILTEWLVINCQMGDLAAMQQLMKMWYPKLTRYAVRQIGEQQKSEDAVQNTLEVMSRTIGKLQDSAAFPKWIYQILQHKCVDVIRSKQRQENLETGYREYVEVIATQASIEPFDLSFEDMLKQLPTELYQLVHLYYLEGLSVIEIHQVVAIPIGTIKSRLHHARQIIRSTLTGD